MADVLKKFGRYFLLDQVAQGGMAEIYRARLASVDGAGRLLVIKRIQAGFDGNNEFLKMFKDEIKVTMGFNHPNIVQLYDFGEEADQPYIAMEFVDGKNLRQFISRFAELRQSYPVELATYVIEQAASGLHYAHSFKDKISGQPLNIVHRDISPQNLLISYEGTVKVIDFGIAKAATNVESTRAGVIKGKPSYLSPEQISGEVLDGRSDVFSLGAVLWEVLTGKKLFAGENDLAVLKMIESCQSHVKPPSTLNPKVPKELDYIVLKSLAKQRDKRFQSAEEFQRALHKFLYAFMPDFNPSDLGYYAKDLFKNDIVEDRKKIQRLNDEVERLISAPSGIELAPSRGSGISIAVEDKTVVGGRAPSPAIELEVKKGDSVLEMENGPAMPASRPRASMPGAPLGPASRGSAPVTRQQLAQMARPQAPQQRVAPAASDDSSSKKTILVAIAASVAVIFMGPQLGIRIPVVTDLVESIAGSDGSLTLQGNEKNVTVLVDGHPVANSLPATLKSIPIGTPFRVNVVGANGNFEQVITVVKGEKKDLAVSFVPVDRKVASPGVPNMSTQPVPEVASIVQPGRPSILLRLNITPGGGHPLLTIGGKAIDADNPVISVPLDAPLEMLAERQGFRSLRREFVIESRQVAGLKEYLMDVPMEPVQFGYLTIHTTPSADATIMLEGKPWVKKTPLEHEKVPVGTYQIKLANEVLGMEKTVNVTVQEGRVVNIDERLEIKD